MNVGCETDPVELIKIVPKCSIEIQTERVSPRPVEKDYINYDWAES